MSARRISMVQVSCNVCDEVYDTEGQGFTQLFDTIADAIACICDDNWQILADGYAICPADDDEHAASRSCSRFGALAPTHTHATAEISAVLQRVDADVRALAEASPYRHAIIDNDRRYAPGGVVQGASAHLYVEDEAPSLAAPRRSFWWHLRRQLSRVDWTRAVFFLGAVFAGNVVAGLIERSIGEALATLVGLTTVLAVVLVEVLWDRRRSR